jgi:hypothetical protein
MAMTVMTLCNCGHKFSVYFPKQKIYGELLEVPGEDWEEVDRKEVADCEVELARQIALTILGATFVDSSVDTESSCPECSRVLRLDDLERDLIKDRKTIH